MVLTLKAYSEGRSNYFQNELEARLNYAKDYGDIDVNALDRLSSNTNWYIN